MELIIVILCFIVWGIILYWGMREKDPDKRRRIQIWGGCSVGISIVIVTVMSLVMRHCNFSDTEYLSYYITRIRHTDRWNEYIHKTCTREVRCGTDSKGRAIYRTEHYDCSYVDNHPERWLMYDNGGGETYITKEEFNRIRRMWKTEMIFVDMHRRYHTIDGDAQDYMWDTEKEHIITYTESHDYTNKISGSQSVLKYRNINKEEAAELGLFDYPGDFSYDTPMKSILSKSYKVGAHEEKRFEHINGYYGKSRQFRCFVLLFPDSLGVGITEDQKAYWQGGNKNEFVVCIGLKGDSITWANCFSWQESPELDVKCKTWLLGQNKLNLIKLGDWIETNMKLWKRREFKEFDYISSFLTGEQVMALLWTILIFNLMSIIVLRCSIWKMDYLDV